MRDRYDRKVWEEFQAWCRARRLKPLPAHPWTLAAYARWLEPRHRTATIARKITAIGRVHVFRGRPPPDRNPIVARTLRMIEARRKHRSRGKSLFRDEDFRQAETQPDRPSSPAEADRTERPRRGLRQSPRLVRRRPSS